MVAGIGAKSKKWLVYFRSGFDDGPKPKEKTYASKEKAIAWADQFSGVCEFSSVWDQETHTKVHIAGNPDLWSRCCSKGARSERKKNLNKEIECKDLGA